MCFNESGTDGAEYSKEEGYRCHQVPSILLGICSLNVLVLHETLLVSVLMYLYVLMRQCYGKRRYQEFGLYRWTILEDCYVLGGWIRSQMHG